MKAERSAVERREHDSRVFHDGCRVEMGIQITLLHSVPIYMPLCHLQAAQRGGEEGEEGAAEEDRRATAMEGGERLGEKWKWEKGRDERRRGRFDRGGRSRNRRKTDL